MSPYLAEEVYLKITGLVVSIFNEKSISEGFPLAPNCKLVPAFNLVFEKE
jgi:hypothetical protein